MQINKDLLIKIGLGIAAVIVLLAVLSFLLSLVRFLLPIALIVLAGYFGYRWWQNRDSGDAIVKTKPESIQDERYEKNIATEQSSRSSKPSVVVGDAKVVETTGFGKAPDIARLEDKEKEQPQVNDDVRSQIEERRKRLGLD